MDNNEINTPTKRYIEHILKVKKERSLSHEEISQKMGLYSVNPRTYLYRLKKGQHLSVQEILVAQQYYGLNPADLFDNSPSSAKSKKREEAQNVA